MPGGAGAMDAAALTEGLALPAGGAAVEGLALAAGALLVAGFALGAAADTPGAGLVGAALGEAGALLPHPASARMEMRPAAQREPVSFTACLLSIDDFQTELDQPPVLPWTRASRLVPVRNVLS